jgi:ABC-type lipoprotein release transport system permease subunit
VSDVVIVGLLSLVGTIIGTLSGIIATSRLTTYRIEQLEKKVDKHNNLIERVYELEEQNAVQDEKIVAANHRIDDLEKKG